MRESTRAIPTGTPVNGLAPLGENSLKTTLSLPKKQSRYADFISNTVDYRHSNSGWM